MSINVVAEAGTHLMIGQDNKFAIVERRNNQLYNCHGGQRDGIPADQMSEIGKILDASDWTDEATARAAFEEITSRGTQLSQTMR